MKKMYIFLLFVYLSPIVHALDIDKVSFSVTPGAFIPVSSSTDYFGTGFSLDFASDFVLEKPSFLFLRGEAGYNYVPLIRNDTTSLLFTGGGLGAVFQPAERFTFKTALTSGFYYSYLNGGSSGGGNLYYRGEVLHISTSILL